MGSVSKTTALALGVGWVFRRASSSSTKAAACEGSDGMYTEAGFYIDRVIHR